MIITICHIPFDTNMNLSNSRLLTFLIQQPFFSNLKDSLSYPVTPKSVKPKLRAPNGCKKNWGPILAFFFKFKGSFTMSRYSHIRKTKIKDTTWLPKKLDQKKYISYLFIFLNFNGPRAGLLIITSRIFVLQPDRWMSVRLDPLRFFFGKKKNCSHAVPIILVSQSRVTGHGKGPLKLEKMQKLDPKLFGALIFFHTQDA